MSSRSLPLFPLPVVLFPGTMIPLHIFEERYRMMLARIMEGDRRFGLIYHDPDQSGPFLNEPGRVGTVALVRKQQSLPDGRSLILVKGTERFRIVEEIREETPFFQARVAAVDDHPPSDPEVLVARRRTSLALFEGLLQNLPHVPDALPSFDVEEEVSFRLAAATRMDPFWQQRLLEMRSEAERLERLDPVLRYGMEKGWGEGKAEA